MPRVDWGSLPIKVFPLDSTDRNLFRENEGVVNTGHLKKWLGKNTVRKLLPTWFFQSQIYYQSDKTKAGLHGRTPRTQPANSVADRTWISRFHSLRSRCWRWANRRAVVGHCTWQPLVTREGCQFFTPLFGKRLTKTKSRYQADKEGIVWPMCDLNLAEVSHYSLVQASSTAHWAPSHAHSRLTSLLLGKRAVFNGESHPRKNSLDLDRFNNWIPDIENRSSTWSNEEILL